MSLQCFAFTFSKAGTVWAIDCNKGIAVKSFAKTSRGELGVFSWDSPDVQHNQTLMRFDEQGDGFKYMVKNVDNNDVFITQVSLAGGVWSTLYSQRNKETMVRNGLWVTTGEKFPSRNQCPQTSTAYKMVFPNSTPKANSNSQNSQSDSSAADPNALSLAIYIWTMSIGLTGRCDEELNCLATARKFPREYAIFIEEQKNGPARYEKAQRECATAGDIDRCIRIKTGKE
jgi:hypothetical protein